MEKVKAIIVEDEAPARALLQAYLKDVDEVEVIQECENGFDGLKAIQQHKPDLIFLDIQMPKLTGFEMLELLEDYPKIIFTTAYDEFAIKAFELNAVDYLMKPFSKERFLKALNKALKSVEEKVSDRERIEKVTEAAKENAGIIDRIFVKTGSRIDVVPVKDIIKVEAQDDYVELFTRERSYLKKETMSRLEKSLPPEQFIRVHRSFIINSDYLSKIEKYGKESYMVILQDGSRVQVSKSRIKNLREKLGI
jgi:two-component system LytT family response regulator